MAIQLLRRDRCIFISFHFLSAGYPQHMNTPFIIWWMHIRREPFQFFVAALCYLNAYLSTDVHYFNVFIPNLLNSWNIPPSFIIDDLFTMTLVQIFWKLCAWLTANISKSFEFAKITYPISAQLRCRVISKPVDFSIFATAQPLDDANLTNWHWIKHSLRIYRYSSFLTK